MIRILIVEDEKPIAELIRLSLRRAGYHCQCVYDGLAAADVLERERFDLVLLDIMLPGVDGFSLLEYIRPTGTPVIFLTAKNAVNDRVRGLRMGAEDYIVKPFEVLELLARVDVVLRRYHKTSDTLDIGGLHIDQQAMQVTRDGAPIALTKKEYDRSSSLPGTPASPSTGRRFMSGSGRRTSPTAARRSICMSSGCGKKSVGRQSSGPSIRSVTGWKCNGPHGRKP